MSRLSVTEVIEFSPFVARSLAAMYPREDDVFRQERFVEILQEQFSRHELEEAVASGSETPESLGLLLRTMRRRIIVNLVGRNATGMIGYDEVVRVMSDFAEVAVSSMLRVQAGELAKRFGVPIGFSGAPQDLLIIGMGKLGGRELNVSSDIDLVFLYDEDGETQPTAEYLDARRSLSVQEFYERLARRLIPALNDIEGPGFVFRVDMRLRPNGDSGPIVCSSDMLETYLYTQGRDWERFAWLKGRVVNTPVFADEKTFAGQVKNVQSLVRPFVFRKYLDFGAIASLTKLHEMIRAETTRREIARGGAYVNVKLGRGGIREIEFLTQTLQVIRGGRDPSLRGRETLVMLDALAGEGAISREMADTLKTSYVFLRDVEHAIQYVNDEQTQRLSRCGDNLPNVAGLLGIREDELWEKLDRVNDFVSAAFDSIFQTEKTERKGDWPLGWETGTSTAAKALSEKLVSLGYREDVEELVSRILRLASARDGRNMSDEARGRLQTLIPMVAERCSEWQKNESTCRVSLSEVLSRYLRLLEAIAGRSTYIALLAQYPRAVDRVGRVLAASRWSTDFIVRHPIILDELVDGRVKEMNDFTPVDWSDWTEALHRALSEAEGDQERQMNILRDAHHSAVFRLLIADLDGRFTVERLADQLSALADAVLGEIIELAWASLRKKHCDRPKFAVIGYGKLGGKELGYDSDLDIVFIYDDPDQEADLTYSRLVRRMMSWLTLQTSSGKLFDVDLRLRPNGESGLIVTPLEMFMRYQQNADGRGAWFWEHQALSRARFVAGDADLGRRFEETRCRVLQMERDPEAAKRSVLDMRRKMLEGHPNRTPYFDVKHDRGGMVDVEFTVQLLVLTFAREHPELLNNFGNILLLETAARLQLVDKEIADRAVAAYRHYREVQHEIRLNAGEGLPVRVPSELFLTEREAVKCLWQSVFGTDEPRRETI